MRIFALSDIHVDHSANADWISSLSIEEYQDDILILAGDIADQFHLFGWAIETLTRRFRKVLFVPGNHDLWVIREPTAGNSIQKLNILRKIVEDNGASMKPFIDPAISIIPIFGWYDYSFGSPCDDLRLKWMDYRACAWPGNANAEQISEYFDQFNNDIDNLSSQYVMTFSHFLPRIDVMPYNVPESTKCLYPIFGSSKIESRLRYHNSSVHVYGHSHLNRDVEIEGVRYINSSLGYPREAGISKRTLLNITNV